MSESRNYDEIRADLAVLERYEREYGHLRVAEPLAGLSEIGIARHRLADDVPALLERAENARRVLNERMSAARAEIADLRAALGRPNTDDLLGIASDWCGGLSVDEFMDKQRRRGGNQ